MVYLSLGSNNGEADKHIVQGMLALNDMFAGPLHISSLYRSAPQDVLDQPDFLNCACCFQPPDTMTPESLLTSIHRVEAQEGRDRAKEASKGPRTLDIDIILWDDQVIEVLTPEGWSRLSIPHPRFRQRRFVLIPLIELNPGLIDPVSGVLLKNLEAGLQNDVQQGIYLDSSPLYNSLTSQLRNNN